MNHHRNPAPGAAFLLAVLIIMTSVHIGPPLPGDPDPPIGDATACSWIAPETSAIMWISDDLYVVDHDSNYSRNMSIKMNNLTSGTTTYLASYYFLNGDFSVSPNGRYLAFVTSTGNDPSCRPVNSKLVVHDIIGQELLGVFSGCAEYYEVFGWSMDSTVLEIGLGEGPQIKLEFYWLPSLERMDKNVVTWRFETDVFNESLSGDLEGVEYSPLFHIDYTEYNDVGNCAGESQLSSHPYVGVWALALIIMGMGVALFYVLGTKRKRRNDDEEPPDQREVPHMMRRM